MAIHNLYSYLGIYGIDFIKLLPIFSSKYSLSYNQPQLKLYEPMPTADRKVVFDQNYPNDQETGDDINQHKTLAPNYLQNETAESTVVSSTDGKISKSAAKDITGKIFLHTIYSFKVTLYLLDILE